MKNYLENVIKIYEENIIERPTQRKNGGVQLMKEFKDKNVLNTLNSLTEEEFAKIKGEYPEVKIKFKTGPAYNLTTNPWIQLYYLDKNSKGRFGNYCGLSIERDKNTASLWIGFGKDGLSKNEKDARKENLLFKYKSAYGEKLENGFEYTGSDAIIISKNYNIKDINDENFTRDIKYILDMYINIENRNVMELNNNIETKKEESETYRKSKKIEGLNIIYKGYPGSGKSYKIEETYLKNSDGELIDSRCYERVVFYQDYTNADFIGTIRTTIKNHQPTYEFFPGPFTTILKRAIENKETNFYLIIEEINRGKAESIFGDILVLLDRNESGRSEYEISNNLVSEYVFNDENKKIYIPENLSIIASMNVSDENVQTMDTAFERRWNTEWILGENGVYDDKYIKGLNIKWGIFREIINKYIVSEQGMLHNEDKQLGAYFINESMVSDEINENKKDREKFLYKVVLYLYNKVCKYDKTLLFNEEITSIKELINTFLSNNYLNIFNSKIREEYEKNNN